MKSGVALLLVVVIGGWLAFQLLAGGATSTLERTAFLGYDMVATHVTGQESTTRSLQGVLLALKEQEELLGRDADGLAAQIAQSELFQRHLEQFVAGLDRDSDSHEEQELVARLAALAAYRDTRRRLAELRPMAEQALALARIGEITQAQAFLDDVAIELETQLRIAMMQTGALPELEVTDGAEGTPTQ